MLCLVIKLFLSWDCKQPANSVGKIDGAGPELFACDQWYQLMLFLMHEILYPLLILTHLPLVQHKCVSESGQHWFRWWLVAYSAPSHYLNQCWNIVNWTLRNKHPWNFSQKLNFFIQENVFENVVCEMAAILSRGRWVKAHYNITHSRPMPRGLWSD